MDLAQERMSGMVRTLAHHRREQPGSQEGEKDGAETKTFADLSFFFPAAGCQTSREHEEKHVMP